MGVVLSFDSHYLLLCLFITVGIQYIGFAAAFTLQSENFFDLLGALNFIALGVVPLVLGGTFYSRQIIACSFLVVSRGFLGSFLLFRALKRGGDARLQNHLIVNLYRIPVDIENMGLHGVARVRGIRGVACGQVRRSGARVRFSARCAVRGAVSDDDTNMPGSTSSRASGCFLGYGPIRSSGCTLSAHPSSFCSAHLTQTQISDGAISWAWRCGCWAS